MILRPPPVFLPRVAAAPLPATDKHMVNNRLSSTRHSCFSALRPFPSKDHTCRPRLSRFLCVQRDVLSPPPPWLRRGSARFAEHIRSIWRAFAENGGSTNTRQMLPVCSATQAQPWRKHNPPPPRTRLRPLPGSVSPPRPDRPHLSQPQSLHFPPPTPVFVMAVKITAVT